MFHGGGSTAAKFDSGDFVDLHELEIAVPPRDEESKILLPIPLRFAMGKPGRINKEMRIMPSNLLLRFVVAKRSGLSLQCNAVLKNLVRKTFRADYELNV